MTKNHELSEIELIWLIAWNIADGEWNKVGLEEKGGHELLLHIFRELQGDLLQAAKASRIRLQQSLMAARRGTFEEIQQEAPFSQHAQHNMRILLGAWLRDGDKGFARQWPDSFPPGWEAGRAAQTPVRIIADTGDCEERALEVVGAPDRETRVAAEWWYLYYTLGRAWEPGMHLTVFGEKEGTHFSVHKIRVFPEFRREIYFRLPW